MNAATVVSMRKNGHYSPVWVFTGETRNNRAIAWVRERQNDPQFSGCLWEITTGVGLNGTSPTNGAIKPPKRVR